MVIISTDNGNTYGHPTGECLDRLHAAGVKTYWTSNGDGVAPDPGNDVIEGDIVVESAPNSSTFTLTDYGADLDIRVALEPNGWLGAG